MRNRPVDNKWIGQKMLDPEIDLAALARAQGARGFGPITEARRNSRRVRRRRSPRWMPARSRWSMSASSPDTAPATPAAPCTQERLNGPRRSVARGIMATVSTRAERTSEALRGKRPAFSSSTTSTCNTRPRTARWSRSITSRSPCARANSSPSSARQAAASPRCSTWSAACSTATRARSPWPARPCAGRIPRSAWCSRRNPPSRGAR